MQADAKMGEFVWQPKKKQLILKLPQQAMPLYGEVAEARLMSLAQTMDAEVTVKTVR